MYDPTDKIKLINLLKNRLIDKGVVRNKVIAEDIARKWVTMKIGLLKDMKEKEITKDIDF